VTTGRQDKDIADLLTDNLQYTLSDRYIEVKPVDMGFLIDYIDREFNPEDVFSENSLRDWAFRNGFVEEK